MQAVLRTAMRPPSLQLRPFPMVPRIMPRFFFDLFFDRYVVLDPGGMLFEYPTSAAVAAEEMARHLHLARSELRNSGSWIRVRDERRREVCRSAIDPDTAGVSTA
jgi:hypothetical protein